MARRRYDRQTLLDLPVDAFRIGPAIIQPIGRQLHVIAPSAYDPILRACAAELDGTGLSWWVQLRYQKRLIEALRKEVDPLFGGPIDEG